MDDNSFIVSFFEVIGDLIKSVGESFIRESLSRKMIRLGGINPERVYSGINNLRSRGIIKDFGNKYKFTKKGQDWFRRSGYKYISSKSKKWDGKWRIIIFDIPQSLHKVRNTFRRRLKMANFFMLQKSIFVFPYECDEELEYLCEDLGLSEYVDIIIADSIKSKDVELKKYFSIE